MPSAVESLSIAEFLSPLTFSSVLLSSSDRSLAAKTSVPIFDPSFAFFRAPSLNLSFSSVSFNAFSNAFTFLATPSIFPAVAFKSSSSSLRRTFALATSSARTFIPSLLSRCLCSCSARAALPISAHLFSHLTPATPAYSSAPSQHRS